MSEALRVPGEGSGRDGGPSAGAARPPRLPKAYRIKEQLLELLRTSEPGSPIDSERTLAERFGVSRATIRQALKDLTFEGRLYRLQGRGTFIARPKLTQSLQLTSHTREMVDSGLVPSSDLLEAVRLPAAGEVAKMLALAEGAEVCKIERLRRANGEPMAIESLYLPASRFPGIEERIAAGASFYDSLRDYGVSLGGGEESIECVLASPSAAELLAVEPRNPMLKLTRHSWDSERQPIEYVESFYRGDRYRFVTPLRLPSEAPGR